jgi:ABC-type amino acid transport system permease subunit
VTLVLLIFYAMPEFGISLNPLPAAVLALTLSTTAFNCEIWRSALVEFPKDQLDAANALGLNRFMRMRLIVFPQIWRASLPGIFNEITLQIKSTPAVAVIGIVEITRAALRVGSNTYEPLPPFIFALLIYSAIVYVFLKLQKFFEVQMKEQGYI